MAVPTPTHWYAFEGDLTDSAGSANLSNYSTSVTYSQPGTGMAGDGGQDVLVPQSSILTATMQPLSNFVGDITVSGWIRLSSSSIQTLARIFVIGGDASSEAGSENELISLTVYPDGAIWYLHESGNGDELHQFSHTFSLDTAVHFAVVRDDSAKTASLYINGYFVDSISYTNSASTTDTSDKLWLGGYSFVYSISTFQADYDNVKIWAGTALTAAEVLEEYGGEPDPTAVTGTVTAVQGSQTAEGDAQKTGTDAGTGTAVAVQSSQTATVAATNTDPDNYVLAVQGSQRAVGTITTAGENEKYYFATKGFTTNTYSTPAGQEIPPTLKNPGNFKREINIENFGVVKPSFGEIVISNLDGIHDSFVTKNVDGQKATLYYHPTERVFVLEVEAAP